MRSWRISSDRFGTGTSDGRRGMTRRSSLPTFMVAVIAFSGGCAQSPPARTPLVRALLLSSQKKLPEALTECDRALAAAPNNYQAWVVRGQINQETGNHEAALRDYTRAIALDPANPEAHFYRDQLARSTGPVHQSDESLSATTTPAVWPSVSPRRNGGSSDGHNSVARSTLNDDDWHDEDVEVPKYPQLVTQNRPAPRESNTPYRPRRWDALREPYRAAPPLQNHAAVPLDDPSDQGPPLEFPPIRHVVQFGYPLGTPMPHWVQRPTSTTGRHRGCEPEEFTRRPAQIVGQLLPPRPTFTTRSAPSSTLFAPMTIERADLPPPSRSCADRMDNNGNGYTDQDDPACWLDGTNPRTYSPNLYETQVPTAVVPRSPSVPRSPTLPQSPTAP